MAFDFVKKGASAVKLAEHDKVKQEERRAEMGKAWRFFLKKKEERKILFVDGEIDPNTKDLLPGRVYEHTVNVNGQWRNFVCPKDTDPGAGNPCGLCQTGDRNSLVNLLTVIDLTPAQSKDGKKTHPFTRKLYVFKNDVYEKLNFFAKEFGGLSGHVFKTARMGEKSERVGDVFVHLNQVTNVEQAKQKFTTSFKVKNTDGKEEIKTVCLYEPLDYNAELTFKNSDELAKMGIGAPSSGSFGTQAAAAGASEEPGDVNEFIDQM